MREIGILNGPSSININTEINDYNNSINVLSKRPDKATKREFVIFVTTAKKLFDIISKVQVEKDYNLWKKNNSAGLLKDLEVLKNKALVIENGFEQIQDKFETQEESQRARKVLFSNKKRIEKYYLTIRREIVKEDIKNVNEQTKHEPKTPKPNPKKVIHDMKEADENKACGLICPEWCPSFLRLF